MDPDRLRELLELHFDPKWGAPYWVERRASLGFDPIEVTKVEDLCLFPPFPRQALVELPIQQLIPRRFHDQLAHFVTCESGGTTGPAACTAFREDEFHDAFVAPFLAAAEFAGFPPGEHWLFVGPGGPHPIGKAARLCATSTGSVDPFTVDFDPRWSRKLQGFARERYLEHVLEQALALLRTQEVGVLFATPPVLEQLAARLSETVRERIRGIHTGGVAPPPVFWTRLSDWYPSAVVMSGYGNSLAGMCPQLEHLPGCAPAYFPHGKRLIYDILHGSSQSNGRVLFHRLDESTFLPHVVERDLARVADPPPGADGFGFTATGLQGPHPAEPAQGVELY